MTDELEKRLRGALKPIDPPGGFAERVLGRLADQADANIEAPRLRPSMRSLRRHWYSGVALAASIAFAVVAIDQLQDERSEREGLEARRQLIEALRVTSEKLDLAYEAVNSPVRLDNTGARARSCPTPLLQNSCAAGA